MEWNDKNFNKKQQEKRDRIRRITVFCFFPRTINGATYWLKTITIKQRLSSPDIFYNTHWMDDRID